MELMQLRYFREVAHQESFSRAAETLHITQSALSKSIAKLEDEIGIKLFEREGNRIHLNRFGEMLLHYSNLATINLNTGISQIRESAGLGGGSIRIGVSNDVFIKHLVRDFILRHPNINMVCLLQSPQQMEQSLQAGSVDFVLSTDPLAGNELNWTPLYEDHLTVILSSEHPLSQESSASLSQFADDHFIITNMGFGMVNSTRALCNRAGFEPQIIYEGYDTELAEQVVGANLAVEITPHSITEGVQRYQTTFRAMKPKILSVSLNDDFTRKQIGLTEKKGHFYSKAALEFRSDVVNYFSSLDT